MLHQKKHDPSPRIYMDYITFEDYLDHIRAKHPRLYHLLEPKRIEAAAMDAYIAQMDELSWVFEGNEVGGRGTAYHVAQQNFDNRSVGMKQLIECFSPSWSGLPGPDFIILDVLGGGGTVARFLSSLATPTPTIFTADLSNLMISGCRARKAPCIRQSASKSLFRDNVLDGVLIAYGSQLLDRETRRLAVSEAHRTLKAGHRLVFHAFEVGTNIARFFDNVVHPYSRTGHPHEHYTRSELLDLFTQAGFRDLRIFEMFDPFILRGETAAAARRNAILHVYRMYDLTKVADDEDGVETALGPLIEKTLGPITVSCDESQFAALIPRSTVVAVGTKSAA